MAPANKSSRIIVKNLPKQISDERVKEHFAQKGEITDVKLKFTRSGHFRRFCFIGYKTVKEAEAAVAFFNNTYIDTSKIEVEPAKSLKDDDVERPWSKYSQGSSAHDAYLARKREEEKAKAEQAQAEAQVHETRVKAREAAKQKKAKVAQMLAEIYGDPEDEKLQEFLEVTQPRGKAATWSNEDTVLAQAQKKAEKGLGQKAKIRIEDVDARRPAVEGTTHSRVHIAFMSDEEGGGSDDEYQDIQAEEEQPPADVAPDDGGGGGDNGDVSTAALDAVSDLDYFRMKRGTMKDDDEEEEDGDGDGDGDDDESLHTDSDDEAEAEAEVDAPATNGEAENEDAPSEANEEAAQVAADADDGATANGDARKVGAGGEVVDEASVAETGRLFVRNLPYTCTEEELAQVFQRLGPLTEVHMPLDKETKRPLGFAHIVYMMPEHAVRALEDIDGTIFQGRLIHVLPGRAKVDARGKESGAGRTFKEKRAAEKKAQAEAEHTWNTLFMRSDTVAEALSRKLKISKSELLSRDADSMAVRMALGETHIIQETKKYLEDEGIRLEAFEGRKKRSNTVIIVKNIPFEVTVDDIRAVFDKFGVLGRIILPPTRTIALVEFAESADAKKAFRNLAYTQFRNVPLYLEWAPEDTFMSDLDREALKARAEADSSPRDAADQDDDEPRNTVFVKNLSFDTTDESLRKAFERAGAVRSARIAKKKDMKNKGKMLSMGFGFVEYASKDGAANAVKTLQGVKLDGHVLELKMAKNQPAAASREQTVIEKGGKAKGTKLLVKNVPFEATKKELQELFGTFGQLKSVRIPRKFDGTHRGFAFVDFVSKQEAKNAMEALRTTHFYGRHLVLDWAEEEAGVEALRAQTAKHYVQESEARSSKRRKVEIARD